MGEGKREGGREEGREGVPLESPQFFFGGQADVTREGLGLKPVAKLAHVVLLVGREGGREGGRERGLEVTGKRGGEGGREGGRG